MKLLPVAFAAAPLLLLAGCVTPTGPVEVTRFHAVDQRAALGKGTIAVIAAPGQETASMEWRGWQLAVERELAKLGYQIATQENRDSAGQIATLALTREMLEPQDKRGPISVGVGGSTGSYGSGVGIGIGLNLGGGPKPEVATRMQVMIRQRDAAGNLAASNLWEGRAAMRVRQGSPIAANDLAASRMAAALFTGFPGQSGETIEVQ